MIKLRGKKKLKPYFISLFIINPLVYPKLVFIIFQSTIKIKSSIGKTEKARLTFNLRAGPKL